MCYWINSPYVWTPCNICPGQYAIMQQIPLSLRLCHCENKLLSLLRPGYHLHHEPIHVIHLSMIMGAYDRTYHRPFSIRIYGFQITWVCMTIRLYYQKISGFENGCYWAIVVGISRVEYYEEYKCVFVRAREHACVRVYIVRVSISYIELQTSRSHKLSVKWHETWIS